MCLKIKQKEGSIMMKAVIFDIGNVLVDFRWKSYISDFGFSPEINKKIAAATVEHPIWNEYDRGVMEDELIINKCIESAPECKKEIELFFTHIGNMVKEYSYSSEWVKDLKKDGYKVYVLSNYPKTPFLYAEKFLDFLQYIDGGVISYEVKTVKPEEKIYKLLLEKYSLQPEECVFLDDRSENILTAEHLGFKTIHFETYEQAREALNAMLGS